MGSVEVVISYDSSKQNIQIVVKDTGIGIKELEQANVFKVFDS